MRSRRAETVLEDIGRRVAEIRRTHGWTQEDLAEKLGVAARYLQAIEQGDENLTVESLVRLADTLQVSVLELFQPPSTKPKRKNR